MPDTPKKPTAKPASKKLPPDPHAQNFRERIMLWLVIFIVVVALVGLYKMSPREKPLVCDGTNPGILAFGSCQ